MPLRWESGVRRPMRLRRESVGGFDLPSPLRLLYASDLHLGRPWTRGVAPQLLGLARVARPHVVLLGGDLCDTPRGLPTLSRLVRRLASRHPVHAVMGNHDRRLSPLLAPAVEAAGGVWIADASPIPGVLVAHDPAVFATSTARLVLAGHLHGGQCVLFERGSRQFPGAWLNRWTGERFTRAGSTLLVSRGCGDTLPARLNCPREALLVTLT